MKKRAFRPRFPSPSTGEGQGGGDPAHPGILVLRAGALGDFALSVPHLMALQNRFDCLTIATHDKYIPFLKAIELGKAFLPLDGAETTRLLYADPPESFEGVVSWLKPGSEHPTVTGRRFSVSVSAGAGSNGHVADGAWKSLEAIGIRPAPPPDLRLRFHEKDGLPRKTVVLHPGSGGEWKRWPLGNYFELAQDLLADHRVERVFMLVGPEDESWCDEARRAKYPDGLSLFESADLIKTAKLLASACLYVGNDSGVTHLSALLGVPTVAIHGPTSADLWGARGRAVAHVLTEAPCPECVGREPRNGLAHSCLRSVTTEAVLRAAFALADAKIPWRVCSSSPERSEGGDAHPGR